MKYLLILFFAITFIFSGCSDSATEVVDEEEMPDCVPMYPEMDVTYENYVKGILNQYCIECHFTGNSPGPGDFTNYEGVLQYTDLFYTMVIQNQATMPQGNAPLPKSTRDSLDVWIQNCTPRN